MTLLPDIDPIRREVALLADARDFQRAFREVWLMPYVVIPTPTLSRPPEPGPYPIDEREIMRQNVAWAFAMRGV